MTSQATYLFVLLATSFIHGSLCANCNQPIGVADPSIVDSQSIIVSSEEPGFEKDKVRHGCCQKEVGAAWCPKKDDPHPFLEIRLDKPTLIGRMVIEPPTRTPNTYPTQFMKSFDLKFKLPEYATYISIAQGLHALSNKTVSSSTLVIQPPQTAEVIRIEPKTSEKLACFKLELYTCDPSSLCPSNYCQNGGVCNGIDTCDCSKTNGFYGAQCQYTVDNIPKSLTEFVRVTTTTVVTTTFNLAFTGTVTLNQDKGVTSVVLPSTSTVDVPVDPNGPCLEDLDNCLSGFSISVVYKFTSLDNGRKYVISNGGSQSETTKVKGVQLMFASNNVYCLISTSDKLWMVNEPVTPLVGDRWYEMTITWSPGRGLQLLQDGKMIGSTVVPASRPASVVNQKMVFGFREKTTLATLTVNRVLIVPMFWTEAERAGIHRGQPHPVTTNQPTTTATATTASTTLGPVPECKFALGMENGNIKDSQITVSSSKPGHGKEKLRAGCCEYEEDGAWCADPADASPWVQIDLDKPMALSALSFKLPGRRGDTVTPENYVQEVRMDYDDPYDNATSMETYSNNIPVTYNATISYRIALEPKAVTTSVRMYITKAHGNACFRFELIGCEPKDLCPVNFCQNNGKCNGDKKCECTDGHYGDRCQLTKTEITPKETTFTDIVNKTLVTDNGGNLTVDGNVTIVKVNESVKVVQVPDGGSVTFPMDNCFQDLTRCTTGFTLTLVLKVTVLTDDDFTILTSGGEDKDSAGLALVYNRHRQTLTFTVKDHAYSWTIKVRPFTWVESHWYKLTLTWSPTSGSKVIINDRILGSLTGGTNSPPATTTKALCIGCSYVSTNKPPSTTTTTTSTRVIWVRSVTTVHIFVTELVRAHFVDVRKDNTPPQPKECTDAKKDLVFKNTAGTEVVTSLGKVKAHGDLSIIKEDSDVILVLDRPGEYIEVSNTGYPCVDDITSCKTNMTYRITFRFNEIHTQPNFILSSGGDIGKSTGFSLYYYQGSLNFWAKDGNMVWMAIYKHVLTTDVWYTMDASWSHVTGITLRLDGAVLQPLMRQGHPASPVTEKHSLHIARSPAPEKNVTSDMDVLVFRLWTKTIEELVELGCADDLTISNPPPTHRQTPEPPLVETRVNFKGIIGTTVVTTYTNFTLVGTVTLEKVTVGNVLVINTPGSYVDIGKTGVPCIDDVTSCTSGFNFRLVFSLIQTTSQPQVLISSGAETSQGKGLTVRYLHKELVIYIKRATETIIGTFPCELKSTYWYTLDVSWSVKGGLQIHINNRIFSGTIKTVSHPKVTVTYTLLLGKSPQGNHTTHMKVYEIDLWTRIYTRITNKRLEIPVIRFPSTRSPDAPPLAPPRTCVTDNLDPATQMSYDLTFKDMANGVVATSDVSFEVTGNPTFDKQNGRALTFNGGDDALELTCVPCLSNELKCDKGFTLLLKMYLEDFCPMVYVLDGIQDPRRDMGLQLSYQDGKFDVLLQAAYKKWVFHAPYSITSGGTYHIQVSWNPGELLVLSVNGIIIGNATALSLPFFFYGESRPMRIGNSWRQVSTCKTTISNMFAVMEYRDVFPIIKETTGAPSTTPVPTTTTAIAPTTTPEDQTKVPEYTWTFVSVTRLVIVSRDLTVSIVGAPKSDNTGIVLNKPGQYLKIPNLKNSCLTNPDRCTNGFTIQVDINLTILEEGSVIFTSGAQRPNAPGITMIYRYGYIHVIASTPTRSWYLTVSRKVITTKTFCTIHVSWSHTTTLKLFVNKILVGVSNTLVPHINTTTSLITDLTIGGGPGTCVVREVHIWLVHIEILINIGVVQVKDTTTAAPTTTPTTTTTAAAPPITTTTTTSAPTTTTTEEATTTTTTTAATTHEATTTTEMPTTTTTQAVTTTVATAAPTTTTSGQCPVGCRKIELCYTPPPSTLSTTPLPTTAAPTTTTTTPTTTTTTPTTTTTTPTTTTTTTTPTTTTTTTTPTTTTTTTTTTTPTTTTEIGCPDLSTSLMLVPATDNNGQALMTCVLSSVPDRNVEVKFTWSVIGHKTEWHATIQSPDKAAPLMVSTMDVKIEDRKIVCSAKARYLVSGAKWCSNTISSNTIHAEIKVKTTHMITVVEGRGNQTIDVTSTVPPSSFCLPQDNGRCVVVITTIVDTERREIRCSRNEIVPQAMLGVSTIGRGNSALCGIVMTKDNWSGDIHIPVKATIDRVRDSDWIRKLKISITVTGEITRRTYTKLIGTVNIKVINRDRRATCSSVNDPHMTTFDSVRYNNFIPGEFVLYKHTSMEYEVRTMYRLCDMRRRNGATCNLGVAVRSGDDVITFTTDPRSYGRNSVIVVQLYLNGQLTPGTKITRFGCGQKYEVLLPHGTIITIVAQRKPFINVYVKATSTDFEQTEGLCGNFNGNGRDDLQGASGRSPNGFSIKWKRTVTMFRGVAAIKLPPPQTYCSCQSGYQPICAPCLDVYHCHTVVRHTTDVTLVIIRYARVSVVTTRRFRRAAGDDDDVIPEGNQLEVGTENWSHDNATEYCRDYLENNDKVQKCQDYIDANQTSESIRNCAEDLEALGDKEWAASHLDHIVEECLTDAQQDPSTWVNGTDDDIAQPPQDIINGLCNVDCGQHGQCVEGACQCADGWTGETCDVGKQTKPEVMKAEEPCDLLESSEGCRSVRIDGNNFVESESLICTFKYVDVIGDKVTPTGDKDEKAKAQYISMYHVICPLPEHQHSSAGQESRSALITVSNDGTVKTESAQSYLHLVYKSSCQYCTVSGRDASCSYLENSCLIDGQCYARYETFKSDDCFRCDPAANKTQWTKTSEPKCMITPTQGGVSPSQNGVRTSAVSTNDDDNHTIIIILGVVCGVLALVIVGVVVIFYKLTQKGKKGQHLYTAPKESSSYPSFDLNRSKVTQPSKFGDVSEMPDAGRLNTYVNPTFQG